ncbi:MAG: Do family serine endopeptidase [Gammaproteobacteria bacterium]|nr:Do family serine endopeptidase [Gammaproteobacteria bacterium]
MSIVSSLRSFSGTLKYVLVGMGSAFVVFFLVDFIKHQDLHLPNSSVEINQISKEDALALTATYGDKTHNAASYATAVDLAAPAVVNIYTTKKIKRDRGPMDDPLLQRFFGDRPPVPMDKLESSLGSGVIVNKDGYILTNNHVIEDADIILVAMRDGRNAEAKVIGTDPESDVAVLKINLDNLPAITFGHADILRIGDVVLAIGNPFGVGQTVTMGIVSATGREQLGLSTFEDFIQTDAAINPGNSGGALINAYGHLVGVNTAIYSQSGGSQGIGFAIPIDVVVDISSQIIEHGFVARGWIGIEIQDLTPVLAESFNLKNTSGVIIAGVLQGGPAHKAGLTPGDVLIRVNDNAVNNTSAALKSIAKIRPGNKANLTIVRNGKEMEVSALTEQRPTPPAKD